MTTTPILIAADLGNVTTKYRHQGGAWAIAPSLVRMLSSRPGYCFINRVRPPRRSPRPPRPAAPPVTPPLITDGIALDDATRQRCRTVAARRMLPRSSPAVPDPTPDAAFTPPPDPAPPPPRAGGPTPPPEAAPPYPALPHRLPCPSAPTLGAATSLNTDGTVGAGVAMRRAAIRATLRLKGSVSLSVNLVLNPNVEPCNPCVVPLRP